MYFFTIHRLKLSPYKSSEFQDKFGNHVYWLQLIRRPKLVGNTVVWTDVYQEIQPNTVPNRCEIKFQTSLQGTIITKYYKPIKLSQNANDVIDNYPFAAWTSLITVSTETIHVLKLTRITGINDPMLHLIPELILSWQLFLLFGTDVKVDTKRVILVNWLNTECSVLVGNATQNKFSLFLTCIRCGLKIMVDPNYSSWSRLIIFFWTHHLSLILSRDRIQVQSVKPNCFHQ